MSCNSSNAGSTNNAGATAYCACGSHRRWTDCGCAHPAPCEASEPTGCTPPSSITQGIKIYVTDSEGCVHLLTPPSQSAVLHYNASTGKVEWRDGSSSLPICLPALQEVKVGPFDCTARLAIVNDSGCVEALESDPDLFDEDQYSILIRNINGVCGMNPQDLFLGGPGILYQAVTGGPILYTPFPEVDNTYLKWNGSAFEWTEIDTATSASLPGYLNLRISSNGANVITGSIGSVLYEKADGSKLRKDNVSVSGTITASGAGGLDTGAVTNNTWYYVWMISNGTTNAALFSLSNASPTLPAGYDYKVLVSRVRYNTGTLRLFNQIDSTVYLNTPVILPVITEANTLIVSLDLTAIVSPDAKTWIGRAFVTNFDESATGAVVLDMSGITFPVGIVVNEPTYVKIACSAAISSSISSVASSEFSNFPIITPQTAFWGVQTNIGSTPDFSATTTVTGYTI